MICSSVTECTLCHIVLRDKRTGKISFQRNLKVISGISTISYKYPRGTFAAAKQYMKTLNQLIVKCGP